MRTLILTIALFATVAHAERGDYARDQMRFQLQIDQMQRDNDRAIEKQNYENLQRMQDAERLREMRERLIETTQYPQK